MATNSAAIVVGRLLEVRTDAGYRTVPEVDLLFDSIEVEVAKLPPNTRIVTIADWRQCPVMQGDASQRVLQRIKSFNTRTERSSALASLGSPTAVLQFMRLIREAGLTDRKMFFDSNELIDWLSEVLTPAESQRLRQFVSDGSRAGVSYTRTIGSPVEPPAARVAGPKKRR